MLRIIEIVREMPQLVEGAVRLVSQITEELQCCSDIERIASRY